MILFVLLRLSRSPGSPPLSNFRCPELRRAKVLQAETGGGSGETVVGGPSLPTPGPFGGTSVDSNFDDTLVIYPMIGPGRVREENVVWASP